jgi:hypothetical protein
MPVILSPSVRVFEDRTKLSDDAAILLIDNVFRRGTVTASSEVTDGNGFLENAIDGLTFDWWQPASLPADLSVSLDVISPVDCGLIAVHNGITFSFQYFDGDDWIDLHDPIETESTAVFMPVFPEVESFNFRVHVTGALEEDARIGVVMLGKSIRMPRPFYGGHAPVTFNRRTDINTQVTEGGFEKGVMTLRTGAASSVTVRHCPASWVRENLQQINDDLRILPFGFAWRPGSEPDQVAYCWLNNEIRATNNGVRDLMDVTFDFESTVGGRTRIDRVFYLFAITHINNPTGVPNIEYYKIEDGERLDDEDYDIKVGVPVYSVEFNKETKRFAVAVGFSTNNGVDIYDMTAAPILLQSIPPSQFTTGGIEQMLRIRFSEDGEYMAVVETSLRASIWRWDGDKYIKLTTLLYDNIKTAFGFSFDTNLFWATGTNEVFMYEVEGDDVTLFSSQTIADISRTAQEISHDGLYLFAVAAVTGTPGFVFSQLYKRTGTTWAKVQDLEYQSGGSTEWSRDGQYLAFNSRATIDDQAVIIFKRIGDSLTEVFRQPAASLDANRPQPECRWSSDGRYLVSHRRSQFDALQITVIENKGNDEFETLYQFGTNNDLSHRSLTIIEREERVL